MNAGECDESLDCVDFSDEIVCLHVVCVRAALRENEVCWDASDAGCIDAVGCSVVASEEQIEQAAS